MTYALVYSWAGEIPHLLHVNTRVASRRAGPNPGGNVVGCLCVEGWCAAVLPAALALTAAWLYVAPSRHNQNPQES